MPANSRITLFRTWSKKHSSEPVYTSIENIHKRIVEGQPKTKEKIEALRLMTDKDEQKAAKNELVCIMFTGEFSYRDEPGHTKHSGLAIFDFDTKPDKGFKIPNVQAVLDYYAGIRLDSIEGKEGYYALAVEDAEAFRDSFQKIPNVVMAFVSPSGFGVKVVVKVPPSEKTYDGHYESLLRQFVIADSTSRNLARVCFQGYDPNAFFRPYEEAEEYTKYVEIEKVQAKERPDGHTARTDYSLLNKICQVVRLSLDGARHDGLLKASTLAGGYIEAGYIPEEMAKDALFDAFSERPFDTTYNPKATIKAAIIHGRTIPIWDVPEQITVQDSMGKKQEVAIPVTPQTSAIVTVNDVWGIMEHQYINGSPRGQTTFFTGLDGTFSLLKGEKTLLSGIPGDGKSEILMQIQLAQSLYQGTKWAVFSPEHAKPERYFDALIEMLVGLPIDIIYDTRMNGDQYAEAAMFINDHFFYLDMKAQKGHKGILEEFKRAIEYRGVTGVSEDPFNRIYLGSSFTRDDERISEYMDNEQNFSLFHDVYSFTAIHPKTDGMRLNSEGEYPNIGFYQLAGGAMWSNKTDNMLSIYRPYRQNNPKDKTVHFITKKIKLKKTVGDEGTVIGNYDYWQRRHFFGKQNPLNSHDNQYDAISMRMRLAEQGIQKRFEEKQEQLSSTYTGIPEGWD